MRARMAHIVFFSDAAAETDGESVSPYCAMRTDGGEKGAKLSCSDASTNPPKGAPRSET
jgi:hypothetical protein